jgi:hypothetical protein
MKISWKKMSPFEKLGIILNIFYVKHFSELLVENQKKSRKMGRTSKFTCPGNHFLIS